MQPFRQEHTCPACSPGRSVIHQGGSCRRFTQRRVARRPARLQDQARVSTRVYGTEHRTGRRNRNVSCQQAFPGVSGTFTVQVLRPNVQQRHGRRDGARSFLWVSSRIQLRTKHPLCTSPDKTRRSLGAKLQASIHSCAGELANTVRVQHAVPLEEGDVVDHRHAQLRLVLIAPELRQQLRHAKVRVLRPPGGTVVRCIQLCDATTRFRWRSSPCKETPHTGIHTHDEEVCRLRKYIEHHRLGLDVLWPVCTRDSFLLLHFGKSWGDAPSSTYRPRRRPPQKPASSEDQLPPHRTISRPSVTCTDSLLHVYTHTLHSPLHWCSHHQHASSCKR